MSQYKLHTLFSDAYHFCGLAVINALQNFNYNHSCGKVGDAAWKGVFT
jgi:hypothetical protein